MEPVTKEELLEAVTLIAEAIRDNNVESIDHYAYRLDLDIRCAKKEMTSE